MQYLWKFLVTVGVTLVASIILQGVAMVKKKCGCRTPGPRKNGV